MSTNPMISVIAQEMDRLGYGLHESHAQSIWLKIQAEQHQGEPVRMVSAGGKGSGLWQEVSGKTLEECVAFPDEHEFREFYTHADPGEVEGLRAELAQCEAMLRLALDDLGEAGQGTDVRLCRFIEYLDAKAQQKEPLCAVCNGLKMVVSGFDWIARDNIVDACYACTTTSAPVDNPNDETGQARVSVGAVPEGATHVMDFPSACKDPVARYYRAITDTSYEVFDDLVGKWRKVELEKSLRSCLEYLRPISTASVCCGDCPAGCVARAALERKP